MATELHLDRAARWDECRQLRANKCCAREVLLEAGLDLTEDVVIRRTQQVAVVFILDDAYGFFEIGWRRDRIDAY